MANMVDMLREGLQNLSGEERQALADMMNPTSVQVLSKLNPEVGEYLKQYEAADYKVRDVFPQQKGMAEGGVVERGAAPMDPQRPQGKDDLTRKVSEGEFVIPADVVKRLGTEHFEKLIQKTRDQEKEVRAEQAQQKQAAQQAQQQARQTVPPVPSGNEQPTMTGSVAMPKSLEATRRV